MVAGWGLGGPFGVEKLWDSGIKWIRRKIHYYLLEGVSTNITPLTDKVLLLLMVGPKLNLTHNICTKIPMWSCMPLNSQQLSTPPRGGLRGSMPPKRRPSETGPPLVSSVNSLIYIKRALTLSRKHCMLWGTVSTSSNTFLPFLKLIFNFQ